MMIGMLIRFLLYIRSTAVANSKLYAFNTFKGKMFDYGVNRR